MIFTPHGIVKASGSFIFSGNVNATAHPCLNKDIFKELWRNFTFGSSELGTSASEEYIFSIGNAKKLPLDGNAYSINVQKEGLCICADNERDLIHGFMTLIDRFKAIDLGEESAVELEYCEIRDRAAIQTRMVHFCIFPETELWELQRFIRLCGALKYTHVILEFWGTLKYDCMKELSWSFAFTKEQIRPIIREAKELGLEIIPMFNHWGHAPASRVMHGKHVVLDQNPTLQTYFSDDGWCWDIRKPKVKELLRRIRSELIELCGDGGYFHIGCDEAYHFEFTDENMKALSDFINEISDELTAVGRRVIMWGDMLLYKHSHYNPKNRYCCNAPSPEVEKYFLKSLKKDIIIADWQYNSPEAPVETADVFVKAGFDCLLCPWDEGRDEVNASLETINEYSLMGFIHTTWHTLTRGMPYVTQMAKGGFEYAEGYKTESSMRTETAALLRKVMPAGGDYEKAGWSKIQVGFKW